jgi:hypothetical protein
MPEMTHDHATAVRERAAMRIVAVNPPWEPTRRDDLLVGMTDLEVIQHIYSLVPQVDALAQLEPMPGEPAIADALYFALDEVLERFAPAEVMRAELEHSHADNAPAELAASLAARTRRAELRTAAATLRGVGNGDG